MKERPILFNTAMVQAILAGRKTQTRRAAKTSFERGMQGPVVRGKKGEVSTIGFAATAGLCPFGVVGDRLWVRESFRLFDASDECCCADFPCNCPRNGTPVFRASYDDGESKWKPSIHMPRWACRIILEITSVRVERLTDISNLDCKAEGYPADREADGGNFDPFLWFRDVWNSTGGDWGSNPWVWVVEFKVLTTNGKVPEVAS